MKAETKNLHLSADLTQKYLRTTTPFSSRFFLIAVIFIIFYVKVKQSRYRRGVAQRVPGSYGKGKSVPLQAWSGPEGSRKLR